MTGNVSVREQYFLAGNVQAVKLIANRRIYGYDFRAIRVWYAFPATGIFATDGQTSARSGRESGREGERPEHREVRKVDVFFTGPVLSRGGQFRAAFCGKSVKRFPITIAVTTFRRSDLQRSLEYPPRYRSGLAFSYRRSSRLYFETNPQLDRRRTKLVI